MNKRGRGRGRKIKGHRGQKHNNGFAGKPVKPGKTEKVKFRIAKMISSTQSLKEKKLHELDLLNLQQQQLEKLYNEADKMDVYTLKQEIKNIVKAYKSKREKKWDKKHKKWDKKQEKKNRKQEKRENKKERKENKKNYKEKRDSKEEKKAEKIRRKQQNKLKREEKRKLKREKLENLNNARLFLLPSNKEQIGNQNVLKIYVDGYNIIGCDPQCRKSMRGRGGGMKKSRLRLTNLLQQNFLNKKNNLNVPYNINKIYLWFDGNGKNHQNGDIEITFSTKKQIVDDKLVETFSKNKVEDNANILVVTSDRELTLRLHKIGVKVIKSSTFYKTYLKEQQPGTQQPKNEEEKQNDDNNYEMKYEIPEGTAGTEPGGIKGGKVAQGPQAGEEDPIFFKYCAQKMNSTSDEDDDDDTDYEEGDVDDTLDQLEGGDDDDYDAAFGEDMDGIDDD